MINFGRICIRLNCALQIKLYFQIKLYDVDWAPTKSVLVLWGTTHFQAEGYLIIGDRPLVQKPDSSPTNPLYQKRCL
jgi:hypothetical protein